MPGDAKMVSPRAGNGAVAHGQEPEEECRRRGAAELCKGSAHVVDHRSPESLHRLGHVAFRYVHSTANVTPRDSSDLRHSTVPEPDIDARLHDGASKLLSERCLCKPGTKGLSLLLGAGPRSGGQGIICCYI
jgi:hypothetical protein